MCTEPGCPGELPYLITQQVYLTGLNQCPTSSDCGFFSGMALKLLYEGSGNPETQQVSRLQVYQAREAFLRTPPQVLTHRHRRDLGPDAPLFLTGTLHLSGYQSHGVAGVANIWQLMPRYKGGNARFGAMFTTLAGGQGHWTAVLGVRGPQNQREFRIYDPSWATRNMDWLSAAAAAATYPGILTILSTATP